MTQRAVKGMNNENSHAQFTHPLLNYNSWYHDYWIKFTCVYGNQSSGLYSVSYRPGSCHIKGEAKNFFSSTSIKTHIYTMQKWSNVYHPELAIKRYPLEVHV